MDTRHDAPQRPNALALGYWRDVLLITVLCVFALYAGSAFLIPLALAILIFVLITAVSDRVAGLTLFGGQPPAWVAHLLGIATVLTGVFAVMYILGTQATNFARALPQYEAQIDSALSRFAELVGSTIAAFVQDSFVKIDMSIVARSAFGSATSFLTTFFLISLYVTFMMAERQAISRKIQLAAGEDGTGIRINRIMRDISSSLQRYVEVKTFVSVLTGLFSYLVFRMLGLEFAETWAVLTFALNYIPSVGSVVAVILPALVALVQFETIAPFLIIVLGCGTVQFMIGNLLDPALTGRSLNLSTLVVILALTFWSSVWGVIGAFLSVPLTVCLVIVFSHLPRLRPIAVLLSKDGRLLTGRDSLGSAPQGSNKGE